MQKHSSRKSQIVLGSQKLCTLYMSHSVRIRARSVSQVTDTHTDMVILNSVCCLNVKIRFLGTQLGVHMWKD